MILGIPALVGILVLVIYTAFVLSRIVPMDNPIPDTRPMVDNSGRDGSYADQKVLKKKTTRDIKPSVVLPTQYNTGSLK